uniref:Nuclear factor of activated T-cells 5 n=1 Tax=Leptobrachium leishanense TaxID=445787 RepID=A0A8C5WJS6_9ANUR
MPSDFISLLSADLDLESPKSLYSRESVYDLLPKELQLPPSRETSVAPMSQTSGGEAGSPPPAVIAADASSSSASSMGGARSSFTTTSSPSIYSTSLTDTKAMQLESCSSAVGVSKPGVSDQLLAGKAAHQQSMPLRWTVLNISPPPEDLLDSSQMSCQDDGTVPESDQSCSMWTEDSASNFSNMSAHSYNDNTEVPRKSRKRNQKQRPGVKRKDSNMDMFDADSAKAPHYVISQLASDSKGSAPTGNGSLETQKGGKKTSLLCEQYPSKSEGKELKIAVQPETQHRARYLTEGSRGSVKDRTQQGFPTVKLEGHNEPVALQVFVGNDSGRVKPHGFYQACRVTGRNTTPCKEVDIEGTTVIEVMLDPTNMMTLAVDCVGILKLRNADVEARIGLAGSKKKSTRARLVFRVNIQRKDGSFLTLQTPSSPILCTQPAGVPEILKKSLHSCSVKGDEEVFLVGKNFLKGAKVIFQESLADDNSWKSEAEIDMELFHQNHLIVKVPPYHDQHITAPVSVVMYVVTNAGRSHEVQPFTYTPESSSPVKVLVKKEIPSPTQSCNFVDTMKAVSPPGCTMESVTLIPSPRGSPVKSGSLIKNEEVAPMELTADQRSPPLYKASQIAAAAQQKLETSSGNASFSASIAHLPPESDQKTPIQVFNPEPLSTIQTQDITPSNCFAAVASSNQCASSDSIMQHPTPFQIMESQPGEHLPQLSEATPAPPQPPLQDQAQTLQQQLSPGIFSSPSNVSQLQSTMQQLQGSGFQASVPSGSAEVGLGQQLSHVLYSGPGGNENGQTSIGQVQEQLNAGIFQPVGSIANNPSPGIFAPPESAHSLSDTVLSGRTDNLLQQAENSLSNQQQAMETTAALVMDMHHSPGPIQPDLYQTQGSGAGGIQSPVYQQASHLIGGLSTSEEMQIQCDLFSNAGISSGKGSAGQQQLSASSSGIFQPSVTADESTSTQAEQMQSNVFQSMVQMQPGGESQSQVNLFSPAEDMLGVQSSGTQQPGSGLFQQAGDIMALQSSGFLQQPPHVHAPLYHPQNTMGDGQSISPDTQGSIFHPGNSMVQHQSSTTSQEQLFHSQTAMSVLQSSSTPEQQTANMFLSQSAMNTLQNSAVVQEKQLSFFTSQNPLPQLQAGQNPDPQTTFQQQSQLSHMQSTIISQEHQTQQNLFQAQNQPTSMFQATHSMVGMQGSPSPHKQTQNLLYNTQNSMAGMGSQDQQQNMLFSAGQEQMATQEQQQNMLFSAGQEQMATQEQQQNMLFSAGQEQMTAQEQQQNMLFSAGQEQMTAQEQQQNMLFSAGQEQMTAQEQQQNMLFSAGQEQMAAQEQQQNMLFSAGQEQMTAQEQQQNMLFSAGQEQMAAQEQQQNMLFSAGQEQMATQEQQQNMLFSTGQEQMAAQEQQQNMLFSGSQEQMAAQEQQQNMLFSAGQEQMAAQEHQQNLLFSAGQEQMATQEHQQNLLFSAGQEQMATQEQQSQVLFHSQNMDFQAPSPVSSQHDQQQQQQQSPMYHNSAQLQLVQPPAASPDQQVTMFMSPPSMLQSSMSQQELQQAASIFSQPIQGNAASSQQQAAMFHSSVAGALNQMQNPQTSSPQTSGMFLFGIQNNCSQMMPPPSGSLTDQMMALGQPGQPQGDGQSVTTLLSQQMSESSSIASDQNMGKISDLLVSLQNQGSSFSGSF